MYIYIHVHLRTCRCSAVEVREERILHNCQVLVTAFLVGEVHILPLPPGFHNLWDDYHEESFKKYICGALRIVQNEYVLMPTKCLNQYLMKTIVKECRQIGS